MDWLSISGRWGLFVLIYIHRLNREWKNLTYLSLRGCSDITGNGLEALSRMENLHKLEKLWMGGCSNVTDQVVHRLVQCCPNLKELSLSYCPLITDKSFQAIVETCPNLTRLYLYNTGITVIPTDIGDKLPGLERLYLQNNNTVISTQDCMKTI